MQHVGTLLEMMGSSMHSGTLATRSERAGATVGAHPVGYVAVYLYKASREHSESVRLVDVAEAADVSVATVRSHRDTIDELLL